MIDKKAEQTILAWEDEQRGNHILKLLITNHREQKNFEAFSSRLSALAPSIQIKKSDRKNLLPGFLLKENITYSALGLDRELPPFLGGLASIQDNAKKLLPSIKTLLDQVKIPCSLTLYIAGQCPHCPSMVDAIFPLAVFSDNIILTIIDGTLFPEASKKDKVMSVPCLILDNSFRWTGSAEPEEILAMIIRRDASKLSPQTLRTILERGDADWISREMIRANTLFKGFIQLLLHDIWSVRLGAMVIVETLGQEDPELALTLPPILIPAFDQKEIPVQGDILYALGETGNRETKRWMEKTLKNLENNDLKEAAQDAIEAIESRVS
jgi:hypothetical protein